MKKKYLALGAVLAGIVALCAFTFPWTVTTYTVTGTPVSATSGSEDSVAVCNSGDKITGGGYVVNWLPLGGTPTPPFVTGSQPGTNRLGVPLWQAEWYSTVEQSPDTTLTAYAICQHQG